ncbi:MAG: hypothetical protein ACYDFU_03600 [Nitrospirota bacterium]
MAEDFLKGKNLEAVAKDISEGYVFVTPIYLKKFDHETLKKLMAGVHRVMILIRNEKFPTGDVDAIKRRNMRLSRLNNAGTVIKYFAKERKWTL